MKTPEGGPATSIYCATSPLNNSNDNCLVNGVYYSDCQVCEFSREFVDDEIIENLWNISMRLVQEYEQKSINSDAYTEDTIA